jgi:hypothetical protein
MPKVNNHSVGENSPNLFYLFTTSCAYVWHGATDFSGKGLAERVL